MGVVYSRCVCVGLMGGCCILRVSVCGPDGWVLYTGDLMTWVRVRDSGWSCCGNGIVPGCPHTCVCVWYFTFTFVCASLALQVLQLEKKELQLAGAA